MNKTVIGVVCVGAILGTLAFFGYSPFLKVVQQYLGSAAGTTFNTAKIAAVAVNLASPGATGTSTSITNSDVGNRFITGFRYGCTSIGTSNTAYSGTGLASLQLTIGTTSASNPVNIPSGGLIANASVIPTSTIANGIASSTLALGNSAIWHSGEPLTFWLNATNTALCTLGVDYLGG